MIVNLSSSQASSIWCKLIHLVEKAYEDASAHLQNFLEICSTVIIKGIAQDVILLHLFLFSLEGRAK
jgi:hypothetical protein